MISVFSSSPERLSVIGYRIDHRGEVLQLVVIPPEVTPSADVITVAPPARFRRPRWTGVRWVEGSPWWVRLLLLCAAALLAIPARAQLTIHPGSGTVSTANSGAGVQVLKITSGRVITAKTLVAGAGTTITYDADTITITAGSVASGNYTASFTSQTSVALPHNGGTSVPIVRCFDASTPPVEVGYDSLAATSTNVATVTFAATQSGSCAVNSASGGGGGGGDTTTVSNTGAGAQVLKSSTNVTARTLVAGSNVTVSQGTDTITISATGGGGGGTVYTGTGLLGDGSSGSPVRMDPAGGAASQALYTASLSFGTVSAASCSEQSISASGVAAGDAVAAGWPATLPAGVVGMMYGATNLVVVRLCNVTGAGVAVTASLNYSGRVIRGF